jgi:hypothetical protein
VSSSTSGYKFVQNFNAEIMKGVKEAEAIKERKKGSEKFSDVFC